MYPRDKSKGGSDGGKTRSINVYGIVSSLHPLPIQRATDHPQFLNDAGTDARHLRRVLRNLCGRLAVGQHSRRIKIPCRTCGVSRIAEVFVAAAKVPDDLSSGQRAAGFKGKKSSIKKQSGLFWLRPLMAVIDELLVR